MAHRSNHARGAHGGQHWKYKLARERQERGKNGKAKIHVKDGKPLTVTGARLLGFANAEDLMIGDYHA